MLLQLLSNPSLTDLLSILLCSPRFVHFISSLLSPRLVSSPYFSPSFLLSQGWGFSASLFSMEQLENTAHNFDLKPDDDKKVSSLRTTNSGLKLQLFVRLSVRSLIYPIRYPLLNCTHLLISFLLFSLFSLVINIGVHACRQPHNGSGWI